jgi:hypothetical protein
MADHSFRSLVGKLRRMWITTFRRRYFREQLARREGECKGCGRCCELTFRCLFLTKERTCSIYGLVRPANCTAFPIDERDLADVDWQCGFRFRPAAVPAEAGSPSRDTAGTGQPQVPEAELG